MSTYPTSADWDAFLTGHPRAHLLQTTAWGALKSAFGWTVRYIIAGETGAQILFRRIIPGISFAYLPKGPVGETWDALWPQIDAICAQKHAAFIKVEPDRWEKPGEDAHPPMGFQVGTHSIQPPRTLLVDLSGDEDAILSRMKQKTRYNIKLAQKKEIRVRPTDDLDIFYRLMQVTGGRDQFGVHSLAYYRRAYELFHARNACELLLAEFEQEPLAALMVFAQGERAWYLYGASSNEHRERMPTYLLQWEAMRWARQHGCTQYDLWGVPDEDEETLETEFTNRFDGLWGVYRNKRGFGGQLCRAVGPWDRVYSPLAYRLYHWWISRRTNGNG
jgi:lipid II:glycine glycyltransferase (peptidoglycan interpeptide bridge formation enzyme)